MTSILRLVSWNIRRREEAASRFLEGSDYDVGLFQEVPLAKGNWERDYCDRGASVVALSQRAPVACLRSIPLGARPEVDGFNMSAPGTIAMARILPEEGDPFLAVSLYARWEELHPTMARRWIYSDAMAHRAISDISAFVAHKNPARHRILVAGDFNLIHGATESNPLALPARDRSVFGRLDALGFEFLGPQHPDGRKARPTPTGLPADTRNVPTYHTIRQRPETAANQLDYVFASRGFHEQIRTRALNEPEEWGPSDHCRIAIDVDPVT